MRARTAYISSLSTTAILVASAVLMLGLLGAIVGFGHWPRGYGGGQIDSIGVDVPVLRAAPAAAVLPVAHAPAAGAPPAAAPVPAVHVRAAAPAAPQPAAVPAPAGAGVEVVSSRPPAESRPPAPVTIPPKRPPVQPPAPPTPLPDGVTRAIEPLIGPVTGTVGSIGVQPARLAAPGQTASLPD